MLNEIKLNFFSASCQGIVFNCHLMTILILMYVLKLPKLKLIKTNTQEKLKT